MFTNHQIRIIITRKYLFLFFCLGGVFVIYPFTFENNFAISVIHAFLILSLLNIAYLIQHHATLFRINFILGTSLIILSPIILFYPTTFLQITRTVLLLIFYALNISVFLNDITHKDRVTSDVILGALCVYIMIGLLFAGIYNFIELHYPGSFHFDATNIKSQIEQSFNLAYFSFTTLTTVGFGDILPKTFIAKSIVVIEEITGIFYLAVLVSRLVAVAKK